MVCGDGAVIIADEFNLDKISVENCAMAGRSARTFLDEGRWDKVYEALQPGDFVLIQFGHNDAGAYQYRKSPCRTTWFRRGK